LLPGIPERLAGGRHTAVGDFAEVMPSAAIGAVHADPVDPMPTHEDHALLRELGPRRSTQFWPRVVPDRSHRRRSSS
jgi:hypothetical protein